MEEEQNIKPPFTDIGRKENGGKATQLTGGMSICGRKIKVGKFKKKPYVPCFVQQTHMLG